MSKEDPLEEGMATHSSILAWRILMDRGAWWATVYGVAKTQTRLKRLSTDTPIDFMCAEELMLLNCVVMEKTPGLQVDQISQFDPKGKQP